MDGFVPREVGCRVTGYRQELKSGRSRVSVLTGRISLLLCLVFSDCLIYLGYLRCSWKHGHPGNLWHGYTSS